MNDQKGKGDRGEAAAAAALVRQGYTVLERQYRCRWGEIDIIARSPEDILCFVEVKTRSGTAFAQAREFVTAAKQQKLRSAAGCYLAEKDLDCPCRFDVAEVYWAAEDRPRSIHYIINAF
ncbi:MAG: YraN family protein [Oscillospiraceae bacterium]|nr:YraN family protein [Oscillospiraceae bacterium]